MNGNSRQADEHDLHELIAILCEAELTDDQWSALKQLVASDPASCDYYVSAVQLHAMLLRCLDATEGVVTTKHEMLLGPFVAQLVESDDGFDEGADDKELNELLLGLRSNGVFEEDNLRVNGSSRWVNRQNASDGNLSEDKSRDYRVSRSRAESRHLLEAASLENTAKTTDTTSTVCVLT